MSQIVHKQITYSSGNEFGIINIVLTAGESRLRIRNDAITPNSTIQVITDRHTIVPEYIGVSQVIGGWYVLTIEYNPQPFDLNIQIMIS